MLNKLVSFIRSYCLLQPGDRVICAVSGGADSMALLYAMYLLAPKLEFQLSAAHFNHQLRGAESDGDEVFVRRFCQDWQIPLTVGTEAVKSGKKGLEAAARDARYRFLSSLNGKILTAHTADDNAETVLMHMLRGTGLKGLCGIRPVSGTLVRPMLRITREEILAFLQEYSIPYVEDSSNGEDAFLRNRIRHNVMPLLVRENPRLAENLSDMALRLREDASALEKMALSDGICTDVMQLREMPAFQRRRILAAYLCQCGVCEPDASHIALLESVVYSQKPSAKAVFPGGVTVCRNYNVLECVKKTPELKEQVLPCPGTVELELPELKLRIIAKPARERVLKTDCFTVSPAGTMTVRSRRPGDEMRLSGGTKSLKKLFIDRKIPESRRAYVPVLADANGVLGAYGIGANLDRTGQDNYVCITFEVL